MGKSMGDVMGNFAGTNFSIESVTTTYPYMNAENFQGIRKI